MRRAIGFTVLVLLVLRPASAGEVPAPAAWDAKGLWDAWPSARVHRSVQPHAQSGGRHPDGTERTQRRNAQEIDVNRDAQHLATPERLVARAR